METARMNKTPLLVAGSAAAAVAVLLILGAGGIALGILPVPGFLWNPLTGAKSPEHSASYYPEDTFMYAWLTLAPGDGQFEASKEIWDRFNEIPEFSVLYDEFREGFEDDVEYDFEDLKDWAGPDISVAIVAEDWDQDPEVALTVGVRDKGAAEDFLDEWLDYMDREEGANFEDDSYEGFDIWVDEYEDQAYGLSGDLLIFATSEDFLEEVIDGANGDLDDSLADSEAFQEARAALPERRFASLYLDSEAAWEGLSSELRWDDVDAGDSIPEWIAMSSAWGDRSVAVEVVTPSVLDHDLEFPDLNPPASLLPDDTLLLISAAFDTDLDRWRESLEGQRLSDVLGEDAVDDVNDAVESLEYELDAEGLPTAGPRSGFDYFIDLGIAVVDELTGVNLEEELFDHLEGGLSVAVWDIAFDEYGDIEEGPPVSLVTLLSYRSSGEDSLVDTFAELQELLEDEGGVRFDSVDVGTDRDAEIVDIGGDYSPGYVLSDGYVIIASTEDSLVETVELQRGLGDDLNANPEYERAIGLLPEDKHFLAYVDLNAIIRETDPEAFDLDVDLYSSDGRDAEKVDGQALLEESIGAAAATYTLGRQGEDGRDRYSVVLTLFPE